MCPITCPLVLDPSVASTAWSVFCTPSCIHRKHCDSGNPAADKIGCHKAWEGTHRLSPRNVMEYNIIVSCTMHILLPKPSLRPTSLRLLHFPLVTFWIWYSSYSLVASLIAIFHCSGVFLYVTFLFDIIRLYWLYSISMCLSINRKKVGFFGYNFGELGCSVRC